MTPDPYDHVREAFHTVADGLMGWEDPPERSETAPNGTRASGRVYLSTDVETLERAADALVRQGDFTNAVPLWALALRVRHGLKT